MNLEWEQHGDVWKSKGGMFEIRKNPKRITAGFTHPPIELTIFVDWMAHSIGLFETYTKAQDFANEYATELLTTLNKELNNK